MSCELVVFSKDIFQTKICVDSHVYFLQMEIAFES